LHEYIKKYRYSHPEFQYFDKGNISTFVSQEKSRFSDIIEVCTTEVYPQLLKLDNEKVFVWDHTYWMLYRRFLLGTFRFHPKTSSVDDLSNFLMSFQYLFLSLRFSRLPAYAYYFASKFHKLNKMICHFRRYSDTEEEKRFKEFHGAQLFELLNESAQFRQYSDTEEGKRLIEVYGTQMFEQLNEFSQYQVYLHELRHYGYKSGNDFFLRELEMVKSIFKKYDSILSKLPQNNPINGEDRLWDTYYYFAKDEKTDIFEEICCDIFSIVEFVRNFGKTESKQSKEEIFLGYTSTIRYVIEMQSIFTQVEILWKSIKYMLDDIIIGKEPDLKKYSSDQIDRKHIVNSRTSIIFTFAAHILGFDNISLVENELFDSDLYENALQKMSSDSFDYNTIAVPTVYAKEISEKFSPLQLRSARDLLIGWY
jgi:hypothetical protein